MRTAFFIDRWAALWNKKDSVHELMGELLSLVRRLASFLEQRSPASLQFRTILKGKSALLGAGGASQNFTSGAAMISRWQMETSDKLARCLTHGA
jgi:hypothetical protein